VPSIDLASDVAHVAAGGFLTCITTTNDATWCWGLDDYGQLSDGPPRRANNATSMRTQNETETYSLQPVKIGQVQ
jgi:alpha-tubulin suppressor-like RCC1 family protein